MKNEIKDFLIKGYGFDLSIATLSGFAIFSLFQNVIKPLLGLFVGGIDFSQKYIALSSEIPAGTPMAKAMEMGPLLYYGNFIHELWNLIVTAFIIYFAFRIFGKLVKKREAKISE